MTCFSLVAYNWLEYIYCKKFRPFSNRLVVYGFKLLTCLFSCPVYTQPALIFTKYLTKKIYYYLRNNNEDRKIDKLTVSD